MATVGEPTLQGFDPPLPDHHIWIWRKPMLEEVEWTARPKHPLNLCQSGVGIGNRA